MIRDHPMYNVFCIDVMRRAWQKGTAGGREKDTEGQILLGAERRQGSRCFVIMFYAVFAKLSNVHHQLQLVAK